MKEIKVTPEIRSQLMEEFEVSEKTVWNAIKFHTGSYTAKQIRSRAQELGGREWVASDNAEGGAE